MTTEDTKKPLQPLLRIDAIEMDRRPDSDATMVQVALLGLLTILLLTFTAWITYATTG